MLVVGSYLFKLRKFKVSILTVILLLTGCSPEQQAALQEFLDALDADQATARDDELEALINRFGLRIDPVANRTIPAVNSPLSQLGKKLFYSKSLSGDQDVACVTCHHPSLGGADNLSLSVGVAAISDDLLGEGRQDNDALPNVPRNAPTVFNMALWDSGLFWDSRVESLGKEANQNGALSNISTPDSGHGNADFSAGPNLVTAQARFPVTSVEEMKGSTFESGNSNQDVRDHLAARIGDFGEGMGELALNQWLVEFQTAFSSSADAATLITFDNIALALGEFQRSMVFTDNPWQNYIDGSLSAMTDQQKQGAILFFTPTSEGGAGCGACHNGALFSDEGHHALGFPQIGPGKGVGNDDDFGRELVTSNSQDRYRFRTPSLLNVAVTGPYGHSGTYQTLSQVISHYNNPRREAVDFFDDNDLCDLPQFTPVANCSSLYPNGEANTRLALDKLEQDQRDGVSRLGDVRINRTEREQIEAFLNALTDPCVESRSCLAPWIADQVLDNPDGNVLIAIDQFGNPL